MRATSRAFLRISLATTCHVRLGTDQAEREDAVPDNPKEASDA
jgi:hypothetical protein